MGLQRSKVAAVDTDTLSEVRTSSGIFMPGAVDPLLASVEERISRWTRLPVEHGEAFYFLQYEVNQQYQPHHDTFDPTQPGNASRAALLLLLARSLAHSLAALV